MTTPTYWQKKAAFITPPFDKLFVLAGNNHYFFLTGFTAAGRYGLFDFGQSLDDFGYRDKTQHNAESIDQEVEQVFPISRTRQHRGGAHQNDDINRVSHRQVEQGYKDPVQAFEAEPVVRQEFAFASHSISPLLKSGRETPTAVVTLYCIKRKTKKLYLKGLFLAGALQHLARMGKSRFVFFRQSP